MDTQQRLHVIAEEVARQFDTELVNIELKGEGRRKILRVTIDKETGATLSDCEEVSRQFSAILDIEDIVHGSYTLEVTSPGADRPLKTIDDFKRYGGKLVKVVMKKALKGKNRFIGRIKGVSETLIILETEDGEMNIDFQDISKARLEIEIK